MAGRTGYNVNQIKTLMDNIEECYNKLGTTVQSGWETVSSTLKQNWVGEDEQDFEGKLAERISNMYVNTYNLANNSLITIYDLAKAWYDFQKKNKLEGGTSIAVDSSFGLEQKALTQNEEKINVNAKNIEKIALTEPVSVASKVKEIFRELIRNSKFVFGKLFSLNQCSKMEVITAFSGVLELTRRNKVTAEQTELFGDIVIEKAKRDKNIA